MPNPTFQPVIGSGFDQVMNQQAGWTAFNARQDDANIGRANQAQVNWNNYLASLAANDQQAAQYQDRRDAYQSDQALRLQTEKQRRGDYMAQFETNVGLQREAMKEQAKRYDAEQKERYRLEAEQKAFHSNLAESLVENVKGASEALDTAKKAQDEALLAAKTVGSKWMAKLNDPQVMFNPRTNQFEPAIRGGQVPEEIRDQVVEANREVQEVQAAYIAAKMRYDEKTNDWGQLQRTLVQNNMVVKGQGKDAHIYSPILNKSFGQMVKEAGGGVMPTEQPKFVPGGDPQTFAHLMSSGGLNPVDLGPLAGDGTRLPLSLGPMDNSPIEPQPTGIQLKPFVPVPAETSGSVSAEQTPNDGGFFIPSGRAGYLRNQMNLPAAVGRTANAFLENPSNYPESERGWVPTLKRMGVAAVGNPGQWFAPAPAGRVRVKSPPDKTGRTTIGTVPKENLEAALKLGYTPVE